MDRLKEINRQIKEIENLYVCGAEATDQIHEKLYACLTILGNRRMSEINASNTGIIVNSKPISNVSKECACGGLYIYYGKLKNGNYFYGDSDCICEYDKRPYDIGDDPTFCDCHYISTLYDSRFKTDFITQAEAKILEDSLK